MTTRSRYQLDCRTSEVSGLPVWYVIDEIHDCDVLGPLTNAHTAARELEAVRDDLEGPDPDNPRMV